MQAIKTVELVKRYKNITAVDPLNLEVRQGELFSLLGVNVARYIMKVISTTSAPTNTGIRI